MKTDAIDARCQLSWPGFDLDVNLTLPSKGVTAVFGHSGSGKTTLLRFIAGLEHVPGGYLSINGEVWQDDNRIIPTHKRDLGYVFQEAILFPHLTVLDNLRYGLKRIAPDKRSNLDQAIELLGLGHLLGRKPDRLSGGECSRVGIARALAVSPRILLMDEPLAALDLKRKQEILPYLERLRDELDIPMLYVSHSSDEVSRLAEHLVVLEKGTLLASGPLVDILAQIDLPIRIGEDEGAVLHVTVGAIDAEWSLARVDFPGGSLWMPNRGVPVGHQVKIRILARDVSLASNFPVDSSIQNVLRGSVDAIADDEHPALSLVRVCVGESLLVARLTKRAVAALSVALGKEIWVQVKSVALIQ